MPRYFAHISHVTFNGQIQPLSFDQNPTCWTVITGLGIVLLLIFLCSLRM
jgi:hypothetical protein